MELTPEQFGVAFNTAPRPVRSFIIDGKLQAAVLDIVRTRALHVDVGGVLENCASQMLVGIISPAQVLGELVLAGVDADTAKAILQDLNQKIFVPVREGVEHFKETGEDLISPPEKEEDDFIQAAPQINKVLPTPSANLTSVPTKPLVPPMTLVPPLPEISLPPIAVPVPTPIAPLSTPAPVPATPIPTSFTEAPHHNAPLYTEHPAVRTMATDMQAVKEHHEPEAAFSSPVTPASTPISMPAPAPVVHPTAVVFPPPLPPSHADFSPSPAPRVAPPPTNLPGAPTPPPYGVDPYRETFE